MNNSICFASSPMYAPQRNLLSEHQLEEKLFKKELIKKVASVCLAELSVGFTVAKIACCFVAASSVPSVFIVLVSVVAFSTLFHCLEAKFIHEEYVYKRERTSITINPVYIKATRQLLALFRVKRLLVYSTFNNFLQGTLIHEMGHALMAKLFFKNACPKITIHWTGGVTHYYTSPTMLTNWGKFLGYERACFMIRAAGPVFSMIEATILLMIAHQVKDKSPELRWHLIAMAIQRVVTHVFYALSALTLTSADWGHDFYFLWHMGSIHPLLAAITMIAIPLLVQQVLWKIEAYQQRQIA